MESGFVFLLGNLHSVSVCKSFLLREDESRLKVVYPALKQPLVSKDALSRPILLQTQLTDVITFFKFANGNQVNPQNQV